MSRNFKIRLIVGVGLFIVAVISLYTFRGIPFKILYTLFSLVAMLELFSFFTKKFDYKSAALAVLELIFLVGGVIFVARVSPHDFWYIIFGVCGYDIFAYLAGKAIGGKIFKKSRPFPHISKSKTWEGTIFGILCSMLFVAIYMFATGDTNFFFLACGLLGLIGDIFESLLKRRFGVKDSNEILIKHRGLRELEYIVGGSNGHGGFLDRIDSISFAASVLALLTYIFR